MNRLTLSASLAVCGVLVVSLAGCGRWYSKGFVAEALEEPGRIEIDVHVNRKCEIKLAADANRCKGVGRGVGMSCGSPGDRIVWIPRGRTTTIDAIEFRDASPCQNPPARQEDATWACTVEDEPSWERESAEVKRADLFAYDIRATRNAKTCSLDPYFIRSRR